MSENDWCRSLFFHCMFHVGPSLTLMASWWMVYCFFYDIKKFTQKYNSFNQFHFVSRWIHGCRSLPFTRSLFQCFPKMCWCCGAFGGCHLLPSFRHLDFERVYFRSANGYVRTAQGASINWIFNEFTIWRCRRHSPLTIFRSHFQIHINLPWLSAPVCIIIAQNKWNPKNCLRWCAYIAFFLWLSSFGVCQARSQEGLTGQSEI